MVILQTSVMFVVDSGGQSFLTVPSHTQRRMVGMYGVKILAHLREFRAGSPISIPGGGLSVECSGESPETASDSLKPLQQLNSPQRRTLGWLQE